MCFIYTSNTYFAKYFLSNTKTIMSEVKIAAKKVKSVKAEVKKVAAKPVANAKKLV